VFPKIPWSTPPPPQLHPAPLWRGHTELRCQLIMNRVLILLFRTSVIFTRRSLYCDSNATLSRVIERKLFKSWAVWQEVNSQFGKKLTPSVFKIRFDIEPSHGGCCFGNWRTYSGITRSGHGVTSAFAVIVVCASGRTQSDLCVRFGGGGGGCTAGWYRPVNFARHGPPVP